MRSLTIDCNHLELGLSIYLYEIVALRREGVQHLAKC